MIERADSPLRPARVSLVARIAVTLCSALALSATTCIRPSPPTEFWRLTLPDTGAGHAAASGSAALDGTLAVAEYVTPGLYADAGIVYKIGDSQYGAYPLREWAIPLGEQLGVLTERVLTRVPLTHEHAVFDPPSRRAQTYIWRGTVREFDEVNRGRQVLAAVRIDGLVVRAIDDSIVWSGTSRAEREVTDGTMPSIVRTLSELAAEVVTDLAMRARRDISGTGSAALSPAPVQSP